MTRRRPPDPIEEVLAALELVLGSRSTDRQERTFRQYLELFLRWNQVHRMTALASPAAIVRDLFIDSLLFLKVLPRRRPLAVVDLGAGAGIPGLPMRLADPSLALCLVESKRKRVSFLRTACRELGLAEVTVVEGRAEAVALDPALRATFDVAVARAVARIEHLEPLALPYLKPGGLLIVSAALEAAAPTGGRVVRVPVPGTSSTRAFHIVEK
ncbi:MAG TPA: 16S rRNA (guanine(527)-N(7))-methyltransferase RsmG [Methylomirabilota bacterium]